MESPTLRIFISSVSDEFRTYRKALEKELNSSRVKVFEQDQLEYDGTQILIQLKDIIKQYDVVFHLFGERTGKPGNNGIPDKEQLKRLVESEPNLLVTLGIDESELAEISYTHWEAILALYYDKRLFVLTADNSVKRDSYLVDQDVIEFQKNLQDKHRERLQRIGSRKGVRPEKDRIFKGKLSLAKLALRKLCNCHLLPDSVLVSTVTKRSLEEHVRKLKTSTAGTELPLISLEARDNRPSLFREILSWSVPRSIRRYDNSAQGDAEGNQIPKERMVDWCMTGTSTHILIVGEAGAGKSSYLKQLAYDACQKWNWDEWSRRDGNQRCRLPVFLKWSEVLSTLKVDLWKIAEGELDEGSIESIVDRVIDFTIEKISEKEDVRNSLRESATVQGIVFFLDALDEAAARLLSEAPRSGEKTYSTMEFFRLIGILVERLTTRNSIVISTTRSSALAFYSPPRLDYSSQAGESDFLIETGIYELATWSMEDASNYVDKVIGAKNRNLSGLIKANLFSDEKRQAPQDESMKSLWKEPFLLSLFCNLCLEERVAPDSKLESLSELYEVAISYLANSAKHKTQALNEKTNATIRVIGQYCMELYFGSEDGISSSWNVNEKFFDSVVIRLLKSRKNRSVLECFGTEAIQALKYIKSTGFFRVSRESAGSDSVSISFTDYRIFEYMIAKAVSATSKLKQLKLLDRILAIGSNPMILHHIASFSDGLPLVSWWVATRLSIVGYEWDEPKYLTLAHLPRGSFDKEAVERKFLFAVALFRSPLFAKAMQTLDVYNLKGEGSRSYFKFLIQSIHAIILRRSNINFLKSIVVGARREKKYLSVRLRRYCQIRKVGEKEYKYYSPAVCVDQPFFESFCRAYMKTNPRLYSSIPKIIDYFDSTSSSRFTGKRGLFRVKYDANNDGEIKNWFLVPEADLKDRSYYPESDIIGEEFGVDDSFALDKEFRKTFCGVIFQGLCFKLGSLIYLTDGIRKRPLLVQYLYRILPSMSFDIAFLATIFKLYFYLFIGMGFASAIGSLMVVLIYLVSGNGSLIAANPRLSTWIVLIGSLPFVVLGFFFRPIFRFLNIYPTLKELDAPFLDDAEGSRSRSVKDIDEIIRLCSGKLLLDVYERDNLVKDCEKCKGDFFLLGRSRLPYERHTFFDLLESQDLPSLHYFSEDSLFVFVKSFYNDLVCSNSNLFGLEFLQSIYYSQQRTLFLRVVSKVVGCSTDEIQRILGQDNNSTSASGAIKDKRLAVFCDCFRFSSSYYSEENYRKVESNLFDWEVAVEKALCGDLSDVIQFIRTKDNPYEMPLDLWLERHAVDGSIPRIVSTLAENVTIRLQEDIRANSSVGYAILFVALFNEIGFKYHGDEVADFCCCLLSIGFGLSDAGESSGILFMIRKLPPEIRAKNVTELLASLESFSNFYDMFGFYDEQKAVLRRAITGRTIPEVSNFRKRCLKILRLPILLFSRLFFDIFPILRSRLFRS